MTNKNSDACEDRAQTETETDMESEGAVSGGEMCACRGEWSDYREQWTGRTNGQCPCPSWCPSHDQRRHLEVAYYDSETSFRKSDFASNWSNLPECLN